LSFRSEAEESASVVVLLGCSLSPQAIVISPENKVKNRGVLFDTQKTTSTAHVYHAYHHNLTTNYHHVAHRNCKNPLQNRAFTTPEKNK
jgi:hypothetical protein